jgi:MscS family membrane protein
VEDKRIVGFDSFGDFALNITFIYYIKKNSSIADTKTKINLEVLKRFANEGIEMAFPTQTIYTKEG